MSLRLAVFFPLVLLLSMRAGHGQWVQSAGPKGTSVQSLGAADGTLFVGTWSRMFLSKDRGSTWSTDSGISRIGNVILFNGEYFSGTSSGLKKRVAAEGPRPWTLTGLADRRVISLAELGPYLFALSFYGIFRSMDGGVVWDSLPVGIPKGNLTTLMAADGALFVGSSGNGVYRSLDSGKTWMATEGPLSALYVDQLADAGSALFAMAANGLHWSADRGGSWIPLAVDTVNGQPRSLAAAGTDVYLGTSAGWVLRSPDNGSSWTRAQASPSEWPIKAMAAVGSDIFAATETEVFRSPDRGNTWTPVDLLDASISCFASVDGDLFASSSGTGIHRSRDHGANWTTVNRGIRTDAAVYNLAVLGEYVVAATSWHIFRSGDRGATWQQFRTGLPTYPYITSLYAGGSGLYAGSDEGLFRSLDSGQTWKRAGDSTVAKIWAGPMAEMGRHLLLGTYILRPGSGGIYRSSDGGTTWSRPDSGMPPLKIRVLLAKDGFFFAGVNADTAQGVQPIGMYRSADSGATWARINNGLTNLNIGSLITVHGALIVGTRNGAFRSLDNGDSWTPIGDGGIPPILSLTAYGPYLIAGVENGSTWRMPMSQVTSIQGPHRFRTKAANKGQGHDEGSPYDIRGRDASDVSSRAWKIRKQSPRAD